jgi:hypothetical protein
MANQAEPASIFPGLSFVDQAGAKLLKDLVRGGIGITPFRASSRHRPGAGGAHDRELPHRLIWDVMRRCPPVVTGLRRAGFMGRWLYRGRRQRRATDECKCVPYS